nr:MAG TPA: ribonucleoside-diphosphate reductase subunit alpha [Caudoviricetes sp.]
MSINVIKRGGKIVPYNPERINTFLEFVCDGLDNVSVSEIALNSGLMIHDGISTSDINKALLESAHNLISEDTPDYAIVAGRILVCDIRKEVYGDFEPVDLLSIIKDNTQLGWYDPAILEKFSEDEINELNDYIDHDRDLMYSISGMREWESKYLIKNASTGQKFESPQVSYMLVSMMYFIDDKGDGITDRIGFIKEMYDLLSLGYWNIPTPHLARLRTPTKAFSSCVLLPVGDDIESISEASVAARRYATLGAGLGVDVSRLRSRNAPIRGGVAINTGALYHSKSIEEAALSCSQGQTRKGSLTFNWWGLHKDIEEILTYKNNMKKDSEAMKHSDHTIFINGFILDAVRNNQELHCFDPNDVPELYKSFYSDNDEWFLREYKKAIGSDLPRSIINARTYWDSLISERFNTGRVYIAFADNINKQSMYKNDKYLITQSNLCVEIVLPTEPIRKVYNPETETYTQEGLIALCNLGGVNFGAVDKPEDLLRIVKVGHRALDNLLSYQEHPFPAARRHNELFRPLGIGITGLAYWMARHDLNYSNCYHELDKWMQYFSYAAIDASIELAKERGKCLGYEDTKWSEGKLPMDMVNDYYEKFMPHVDHVDWDSLRAKLSKYGIRNASLLAMFPAETSAKVSGSGTTNGIEPIRELLIAKGGKNKRAIFVVPELKRLKNKYDRVWDNLDNTSLIKTYGVIQKYTDQAISCNTYYNKSNYPSGKIPNEIINYDIFLHKALGGKTLYYNNNYDGQSQSFMDGKDIISGGDVTIVTSSDEDDCESCKL